MNQEQAEKCVEGGKQYLRGGNIQGALKFFTKAARLHPDPATDALIKVCQEKLKNASKEKIQKEEEETQNQGSSSSAPSYTPEQVSSFH